MAEPRFWFRQRAAASSVPDPGASWIDTLTKGIAPRWTLQRRRARIAMELLSRHYEAASNGRRTSGWNRSGADPNAVVGQAAANLRTASRDLMRNDSYGESILNTITSYTVGWGIIGSPLKTWGTAQQRARAKLIWDQWANSTQCDVEGRHNFYGLQKLALRSAAEGGEVLVRRRIRRPEDGLVIPMQLQLIEGEYLDSSKDRLLNEVGRRQVQGVEFDAIGRRIAYWLFRDHPGSSVNRGLASDRIPAEEVQHIYKTLRPGQTRGIPWAANVLLRLKDFDDYEDATLMKQKIAACLAVITTDVDGSGPALGREGDTPTDGSLQLDYLEPGIIANIAPGRTITTVSPPTNADHETYSKTVLRGVAAGLGITYEDLTGDYSNVNFSSARLARIRMWANILDWRWHMMIPQFCEPVWRWAMQLAAITDDVIQPDTPSSWTAPPLPMIEPDKEGLAYMRNIRAGITSLSEAQQERGWDPEELLNEIEKDLKALDSRGILLDVDVRNVSQGGQLQGKAAADAQPKPAAPPPAATPPPANDREDAAQRDLILRGLELAIATIGRPAQSPPVTIHSPVTVQASPPPPATQVTVNAPQSPISVSAPIRVEAPDPPPPTQVTVNAPVTTHVEPPPPAQVTVQAPIRVEAPAPPPPAQVTVNTPVTAETRVEAPPAPSVTVTPPAPPQVTVIRARRRKVKKGNRRGE